MGGRDVIEAQPTTAAEGLRWIADLFAQADAKRGVVGETEVQDDFYRWADEVAEVVARDTAVREAAETWVGRLNSGDPWPTTVTIEAMATIAALFGGDSIVHPGAA